MWTFSLKQIINNLKTKRMKKLSLILAVSIFISSCTITKQYETGKGKHKKTITTKKHFL